MMMMTTRSNTNNNNKRASDYGRSNCLLYWTFFKFLDDDEAGQEEKSFVRCHGDTLGRPRLPAAAAGCYVLMV
jgi:hypothetical protein